MTQPTDGGSGSGGQGGVSGRGVRFPISSVSARSSRPTRMLTTRSMEEAEALSTRLAIMVNGSLSAASGRSRAHNTA